MSDPRDLTDGELDSIQILALAEIIREVDGNHSLGAAALAEAILRHPGSRWGRPSPAPAEASAAPTWPANFTRSKRAAQARRLCIAANLPESSPIVNRITREAANGLSLKDVVDLIASESSEPGVSAPVSTTQRHTAPVPAGMIPVEYWDIDSGARIVTEPSEEGPGGCWVVLNSHHISPLIEFSTAEAAWNALQAARALPLPNKEVK